MNRELVSPEGTQEGKNACLLAAIRLQALPTENPEETQNVKNTLAPNRWGAKQRNDFSELQLLHLPIHRKALNTSTWDIYFSLINDNLLNVLVTCPSLQNLYISWLLPSSLQSNSLRVTSGSVSQTWSLKISLQIKHNSQLLGCEYFISPQQQWGLRCYKVTSGTLAYQEKGQAHQISLVKLSSKMHCWKIKLLEESSTHEEILQAILVSLSVSLVGPSWIAKSHLVRKSNTNTDLEHYRLAQEWASFSLYQQPYELATVSIFQISRLRTGSFE